MSLKQLPKINAEAIPGVRWDTPADAVAKWDASIVSANTDSATISIYDQIGEDPWEGGGVTAKRISAALRSIGARDVVVSINSPGGDFFEGIAIYNLLREHPHRVTVNVVGLAASAASVIAMAGDEVRIAKAGFLMIHNAWAFVVGNRHDLSDAASTLGEFDGIMAGLYADATGKSKEDIQKMMDAETWLSGESAVESGFAAGLLAADEVLADTDAASVANSALRRIETILAKQGVPRSERRRLISEVRGTPCAATQVTPCAGLDGELGKNLSKILLGK